MTMPKQFLYHEELEAAQQKADEQWRAGNWRGAVVQYCEIFLSRWRDLEKRQERLTPADLTILERITDFAVPMGMAEQSDVLLAHVAAGYQRMGESYWADRIRIKRIHLALNGHQIDLARCGLGDLFGSPDFSINSVTLWDEQYPHSTESQERDELLAQVWLEVGRLLYLLGRNQQALCCFNFGLGHGAASLHCTMSLQLAVIASLTELGKLDAARPRLAKLESSLDVDLSPATLVAWHESSARIDLLCGDFGPALQHVFQVWKVCCRFRFVSPMLRAMINLAQFHILLNQTIEARAILRHVYAKAVKHSQNEIIVQVLRLLQVAEVALRGGENRAASVTDEQTNAKRVETSDPLLFPVGQEECYTLAHFDDRALAFHWYLSRRHWVKARRSLDRLAPFRCTDSKIIHARLKGMQAMLEYYAGEPGRADILLAEARALFLQLGLEPDRWKIQVLWNRCLKQVDTPESEAAKRAELCARLAQENEDLLETFGKSLPMRNRVNFFLDKATQLDEALASKVHRLQDLKEEINKAGFFGRLRLWFALWRGLNDLLDEAYWQKEAHNAGLLDDAAIIEAERKPTPLWRRVLSTHPREATLVFLVFPDSTVIICRRWLSLNFWVAQVGKPELREKVGRWHQMLPEANPEEQKDILAEIVEQLGLEAVMDGLPRHVKRLRILPDDILHGLPFSAVEIGSSSGNPCYLGKRFSISIAFQPERRTNQKKPSGHGAKPVLAGVTVALEGQPALKRTPHQLSEVRQWLAERGQSCELLLDEKASSEHILQRLRTTSFFHISCHGKFVQGEPENTGLILMDGQSTRILNLLQFAGLRSEQLRHAALISCWGADNFVLPGRWILSLPQVLWRAGARSVLASLWEIEEDVAEQFVRLFYENLRSHPPDVALCRTQESMRKSGTRYRDVQQWAGFQIYGDAERLHF